jgi:hypothetical protein
MSENEAEEQYEAYKAWYILRYGQDGWDALEAHDAEELERHQRECGNTITIGPAHDPYGLSCERDKHGLEVKHRASNPLGAGGYMEWNGGGSVAGDPLRITDIDFGY